MADYRIDFTDQDQHSLAKSNASSFEKTKALLIAAGCDLVDVRPDEGVLETNNAIYKVVEKDVRAIDATRADVADAGKEAFDKAKHFVVNATDVAGAVVDGIRKNGQGGYHGLVGLHAIVATSAMQVDKSIATAEKGPPRASTGKLTFLQWVGALLVFLTQIFIWTIWAARLSRVETADAALGMTLVTLAIATNLFVKSRRLRYGELLPKLDTVYTAFYIASIALLTGREWREQRDAWNAGLTVGLLIYTFLLLVGLFIPGRKKAKTA